jgi:hypothetical protein
MDHTELTKLRRNLGFLTTVVYGIGDIPGAAI